MVLHQRVGPRNETKGGFDAVHQNLMLDTYCIAGPGCCGGDAYMRKTSDVAGMAFLAKKIGRKFGLNMA